MTNNLTLNYSDVKEDHRLPVAFDFTTDDLALVNFHSEDYELQQHKLQLGSYLSQNHLEQICSNAKSMPRFICKNTLLQLNIFEDFSLIKEFFFTSDRFLAAQTYFQKIVHKLADRFEKFTRRVRRTFELAICEDFSRRKITPDLLKKINDRFCYTRTIKLFEIATARQQLVDWNFIIKKSKDTVQQLYQQIIANLERVPLPCAAELKADFQELFLKKAELIELVSKHVKNIDILAQIFI